MLSIKKRWVLSLQWCLCITLTLSHSHTHMLSTVLNLAWWPVHWWYRCSLCCNRLSHWRCPLLRELILPTLRPPYLSLVPQLPQHTLDKLDLKLPIMKDDSVLGHHLQQCLALKHLILYGPDDKLVMMIHSLYEFPILLISGFFEQHAIFCGCVGSKGMSVFMYKPTEYSPSFICGFRIRISNMLCSLRNYNNCKLFEETWNQQWTFIQWVYH